MGTTDANGIYMYEDTDPLTPLASLLNTGQASVSAAVSALDAGTIHFVANTTERAELVSQFLPSPTRPLFVYRQNLNTPNKIEFTTDSTTWRPLYDGPVAGRRVAGGGQNVPNGSTTTLSLSVADGYVGGVTASGASGGLLVPISGWYHISGMVRWESNGTGLRRTTLTKNTDTTIAVAEQGASGAAGSGQSLSVVYPLAANDIVHIRAYQTSGGSLSTATLTANDWPFLSVALIARTG